MVRKHAVRDALVLSSRSDFAVIDRLTSKGSSIYLDRGNRFVQGIHTSGGIQQAKILKAVFQLPDLDTLESCSETLQ
jgi:hypothetical protein